MAYSLERLNSVRNVVVSNPGVLRIFTIEHRRAHSVRRSSSGFVSCVVDFTLKVNNYLVLQPFRTMVTPVMFLLYMYIFDFFLQEINLVREKKIKE